jgi:hypothetical protein
MTTASAGPLVANTTLQAQLQAISPSFGQQLVWFSPKECFDGCHMADTLSDV